jgi:outer membrane protein
MRMIRRRAAPLASLLVLLTAAPARAAQAQADASRLTLRDAVTLALKNNPAVQASAAYAESVDQGIAESRAGRYPRVDFSEGFTRGNNPVYVFGTLLTQRRFVAPDFALNLLNTPLPLDNFQTQFTASAPLYDARQSSRTRDARLKAEGARQAQQRTRQEVIFQTVQSYLNRLRTRESLRVARAAVKEAAADVHRATAREYQGFTVPSDILSAKAQLAQRRQELIEAENAAAIAEATLNETVGLPEGAAHEVGGSFPTGQFRLGNLDELEARALSLRPDYRQAEIRRTQASNGASMARRTFLPAVSTFAAWDRDSLAVGSAGGRNWTAGVTLNFNIFNGGSDRARLTSAVYRERQAKALLALMASQVRLQVREAYLDVQAAKERIAASQEAATQAQESLRIVQNRYEAALATINDVLQGETAYTAAQQNHLNALYDYELSAAAMELATGELGPKSPAVMSWESSTP